MISCLCIAPKISKGEVVYTIFLGDGQNHELTNTQAPSGGPSSWRSNQKLSETHPKDVINGSPSVIKGLLGQALETTQIRPAEGLSQVFDPEQR